MTPAATSRGITPAATSRGLTPVATTEVRMLGKGEITKDVIQESVESAATHVGHIATIITGAIRDIAREVGDFATDLYEVADSSRRARADRTAGDDGAAE
ncbi:MAG: hypothetical protein ACRDTM_12670 [Micromonosporaceae bacterium]